MNQEKIGNFIAKCRKAKKMTQVELAEKLGVSDKSVSKWENAKCMPDLSLFLQLCDVLEITINDLMAGEKVDDKEYINTLENNFISLVSNVERRNKIRRKLLMIIMIIAFLIGITGYYIYFSYELDVKFDNRVMTCEINNNELIYHINGQSIFNTYHTSKKIGTKTIYFFHNTINLYNKKRSNFEYSHSMARLLEGKNVLFSYYENIDIDSENIDVYYTNKSIEKIKKMSEKDLNDELKYSYLICKSY